MLFFLLIFFHSSGCKDLCDPCTLETVTFVRNRCNYYIYSNYEYEDIECKACVLSSGISVDCDSLPSTPGKCSVSALCNSKKYKYSAESFSVPSMSKSSMCSWSIDFSSSDTVDQKISLEFGSGLIGRMIINAYKLPYGVSSTKFTPKMVLIVGKENYKLYKDTIFDNVNWVTIIYYTNNEDVKYAGFSFKWSQNSGDSASELSKILTITALCLVSVFCMGCCAVLCRRLYKSARHSTRVYDQAIATYQNRSRIYEVLPDNSVIYEVDIERLFPKEPFKEELIEVGEKVCCICLEEFSKEIMVRKLPCKHLFHAKCIEEYFVGRVVQPKCPLCKNNPFDPDNSKMREENNQDRSADEVAEDSNQQAK